MNPLKRFAAKSGSEDAARSTLWTTPWRWRTTDGMYVGHNKDVWLYRVMPLNPVQWEDANTRIAVGSPLAGVLEELGATSKDLGGGLRALSRNREIHILSITWEAPAVVPEGTPEELNDFLEHTLDFLIPHKALFVGVKLRSSVQAQMAKTQGNVFEQIKGITTQALGEDVPDLDAYDHDYDLVHGIFARHGGKVPARESLNQLESWYNLGRGPDVAMQETKDLIFVDDFDTIEFAAVMRFETPVFRAPNAQWILDAATHPEGPSVVSVRCELEPSTIARTRLRRTQRKFLNQMEEQQATGDLERSEDRQVLDLAKEVEEYFVDGREPLLSECSIVLARRTSDADETYIDELRSSYGIEIKPLQHRQLAALDETLPTSAKRVNPFLQDVNIGMLAYAGLQAFSNLGDRKGLYLGLVDPDYTPCWLDPFGAPNANLPPAMAIFGDPGGGKAQPLDAKILVPGGWKTMGEMEVGDDVIGADGRTHKVVGVYPQGEKDIYRVTFNDGSSTESCDEHLWTVNTSTGISRGRTWKTLPLSELRADLREKDGSAKWRIPVVAAVQHPEADLPLDPYLLGALLGDGGVTAYAGFSNVDEDVLQSVRDLVPAGTELTQMNGCDWRIVKTERRSRNAAGSTYAQNPVMAALRDLGLMGKRSHEKMIPEAYRFASVQQRLGLLQGILDTDGYVANGKGTGVELSTSSEQLAKDVAELVQSLGGTARLTSRRTGYRNGNGERVEGRTGYRVRICLPADVKPFRCSRKASSLQPRTKYLPSRVIVSVEHVGTKEAQCIRVSAPDHLYVTDDHVVTHNTFLCQMIATQAALAGIQVIMINPKGYDSLSPTADLVGGTVVKMTQLESAGGYFDPARYAPTPEMAAEIAASHILSVLGSGFTDEQELRLAVGLKRGFISGATCVAQALQSVDDATVRRMVQEQAEASTTFALGVGTAPQAPLGSTGGGLTLIEFDRKLDLPDASASPTSYKREQKIALAAIRLVTRASLEILSKAGGGVFILDEAWTFLSSSEGLATLQQLGREGRSLNILPIFATQRVADLVKEGVNLEGYISRVFVMKLMEEREARAALQLCGLDATAGRLKWLREAGPRRAEGGMPGRSALALHRDLKNRHSAVMIGPVPEAARVAFSTNPEERRQRREAQAAAEAAAAPVPAAATTTQE